MISNRSAPSGIPSSFYSGAATAPSPPRHYISIRLASPSACDTFARDTDHSGLRRRRRHGRRRRSVSERHADPARGVGPRIRRRLMARADEFMMSFQRATTAWAWGWAWGDRTLDRKTRSLMNLAMLTALNRAPEIKLHVKGALNNGVSVDEIKAALLHATAYCGIPAGLDAFRAAHEVLVSEGALKPTPAR